MQETAAAALRFFTDTFGGDAEILSTAPGRVNLIGEYTDLSEGFVLPAAIGPGVFVAARQVVGPTTIVSRELGRGEPFDAASVRPGQVQGFAAYAAGVAWTFKVAGPRDVPNLEAVMLSGLPIGVGVSSSAAVEMAFAVLWNALAGPSMGAKELAVLCRRSENEFVGVRCGIMDPLASAMGRKGRAMFLDTRTLEVESVPLPEGLTVALCDTGKGRSLVSSAYNERRRQIEAACNVLGVVALRDVDMTALERERGRLEPTLFKRARHVVTENARCEALADVLVRDDGPAIGELMRASHKSLRDDFEVTGRELDAMAEACWTAPGCIGARMTGAGFGGACVALVESVRFEAFKASVGEAFRKECGADPAIRACQVVDGAKLLLK